MYDAQSASRYTSKAMGCLTYQQPLPHHPFYFIFFPLYSMQKNKIAYLGDVTNSHNPPSTFQSIISHPRLNFICQKKKEKEINLCGNQLPRTIKGEAAPFNLDNAFFFKRKKKSFII